jgi:hypothetical protein
MRRDTRRVPAAILLLAVGLAIPALAGTGPGKTGAGNHSKPATTVEPAPPVSVNVRLANLQKNSRGGVATLSVDTRSAVEVGEVTLDMKLPGGVVFSDGSKSKSWTFNIAAGGTSNVSAELLVDADGKYIIPVKATASYQGKPLNRAVSFKLLVGVEEKRPQPKDGAIEYPGVPGGGV